MMVDSNCLTAAIPSAKCIPVLIPSHQLLEAYLRGRQLTLPSSFDNKHIVLGRRHTHLSRYQRPQDILDGSPVEHVQSVLGFSVPTSSAYFRVVQRLTA